MEESKELKSDESPFVVETGKVVRKILFQDRLNVIFVGTDDREIFVIDPTLGDVIYHTTYGGLEQIISNHLHLIIIDLI